MLQTTAGQVLVNSVLPEGLRDYGRVLDKKGLSDLLRRVAQEHPDRYREISHRLATVGRTVAQDTGGNTFSLRHLSKSKAGQAARQRVEARLAQILDDDSLDDKSREAQILRLAESEMDRQQKEVYDESLGERNPFALQVLSGSRGNKMNLASLRGGDLLYVDNRDRPIPLPVVHSYSEGLTPAEYWAGAYGARKGVVDVKTATADAGYFSKVLNQLTHRLIVTGLDEGPDPDRPNLLRGLPVDTDDPDNEGALLAQTTGPYPRNTHLTPKVLGHLKRLGHDRILVRSPAVGGSPEGGVYGRDVGVRERGVIPGRGEAVGMTAVQSLSEPLTQSQLCLARGTLVRMADWSVKPIEEMRPGDLVLGSDASGRTFPARVVTVHDNGVKSCWRFGFSAPFSRKRAVVADVIATRDHKILALRKYFGQKAQADNYTPRLLPLGAPAPPSRFCAVRPAGFDPGDGFVTHPFARLLGVWVGDGIRVLPGSGVMVSCFDVSLAESISEHIAPLGLNFTRMAGHPGQYYVAQRVDRTDRDDLGRFRPGYRNPLKRLLGEWGLLGKYAHEKTLPSCVFGWDNDSVAELLSGLWVTDGSVYPGDKGEGKPYLSIGSTSKELLEQVKDLLAWRFGIYASGPYANPAQRKHTLFKIDIATELGVKRFVATVRLHGKKRETLAALLAGWRTRRPRNGRYGLIRAGETFVGDLPTFDLEVDHPDHLFVLANGLIVSNSSKHSGGVAGAAQGVSGFAAIERLVNPPKVFPGAAVHAQADGFVARVDPAPAGGFHVVIDGRSHFAPPDLPLRVKPGDEVEAGDVLTEGLPNPAEVTRHKGVGEGRRYFVDTMRRTMKASGINANRRNLELLARGLVNHVKLTEEVGGGVPGDVLPYAHLEHGYQPREGFRRARPADARNAYLERPYLHYSVGTKVRPSVIKELQHFGVDAVDVHDDPPPFEPEFVRGVASLQTDPDWVTRMYGSGLKKSLLSAAHRGATSDETGTSFVPGLSHAVDFGRKGLVHTPERGTRPEEVKLGMEKAANPGDSVKVPGPPAPPSGVRPAPAPKPIGLGRLFEDFGALTRGPDRSPAPAPPLPQPPPPPAPAPTARASAAPPPALGRGAGRAGEGFSLAARSPGVRMGLRAAAPRVAAFTDKWVAPKFSGGAAALAAAPDVYDTYKAVGRGQSKQLAGETAADYRKLLSGGYGLWTPLEALGAPFQVGRNVNLIAQAPAQALDAASNYALQAGRSRRLDDQRREYAGTPDSFENRRRTMLMDRLRRGDPLSEGERQDLSRLQALAPVRMTD